MHIEVPHQTPCLQRHERNIFLTKIFAINELALTVKNFDESLLMSWFYMKSIEKVELRKNALIMHVKNIESIPIQS